MSRQKQIWVILLGLLLILTNSLRETKAQPSPAPLLMTVRGALWSWQQGQKPQPITGEQYNHEPVLSSDGRYLAYAVDHQLAIDPCRLQIDFADVVRHFRLPVGSCDATRQGWECV